MKMSGDLRERNPLALALLLSLLFHLFLFGGWRLGEQLGWWRQNPAWLQRLNPAKWLPKPVLKPLRATTAQPRETPLTFLEVDPATAVPEADPAATTPFDANPNGSVAAPAGPWRITAAEPRLVAISLPLHSPRLPTTLVM